jgi:hypothetical protein
VQPAGSCKCRECSTSKFEDTVVLGGLHVAMARNCKCCEWSELALEDTVGEEMLILLLPSPFAAARPGEKMERILSTDVA